MARHVRSTPHRSANETWSEILRMLRAPATVLAELERARGVACAAIETEVSGAVPMTLMGSGARVKLYCLFGEDAVVGDRANEDSLAFDAFQKEWTLSLPAPAEDAPWMTNALRDCPHVKVRLPDDDPEPSQNARTAAAPTINKEAFFRP